MSSPYSHGSPGPSWNQPTPVPYFQPQQPSVNVLAIVAFILSLIAFFVGWIPFIGLGAGLLGVLLSILAMLQPALRGLAIAGIILSSLATLTGLLVTGAFILSVA